MPNSIRKDFHTDLATTIAKEIFYKRSNYYYFLGKVDSWGEIDKAPSVLQIDSDYENTLIRTNILYMNKIVPNDVSLVAIRYNWESGTSFEMWDHTKNMKNKMFYCLTTDNNVYKCLNNGGDKPSIIQPIGRSFAAFKTSDGYVWKYMYTIPSFKRSMFLSLNYLPVQKSLTDSFYNKGSVDAVTIVNGGDGYVELKGTTVTVTGTTTGTGSSGYVLVDSVGGVTSAVMSNGGSGYTAGVMVKFTSATGSGGSGTAVITGGVITGITITAAGFGYASGDVILLTVGGAVIVPSVSRITGSIEKLTVVSSGAGYTSAPTLSVICDVGAGKYDNPTALVSAILHQGKIVGTNIIDPGIGYRSTTKTLITAVGDGDGAEFTPVIVDGVIVDVIVENYGIGYTYMNLVVSGSGSGAKLTSIIAASDFISDQSIVEQTAIPGAIYAIPVIVAGNNYSLSNTIVEISGDGVGCTATPIITNGQITGITVNTFGSGYTYASIAFIDPTRNTISKPTNAVAYAIFPPTNGHGYDAVSELYGNTLAINSALRRNVDLNSIMQDYRQFGIIKDPTNIVTGRLLNDSFLILVFNVVFSDVSNLVIDEVLIKNGTKYRVIYVSGNNVMLQQLSTKYVDPTGTLAAISESTRTYDAISVTKYPTANKYSGELLYVATEQPFFFTAEQGIIIKTFLKF